MLSACDVSVVVSRDNILNESDLNMGEESEPSDGAAVMASLLLDEALRYGSRVAGN